MQIYQDREEWLSARKKTIGASDVPTIIGVNPYKSPYTLWAEKTGRIEQAESTIAARMGLALEGLIEELYEENTGRVLYGGGLCMHTHPEIPWLTCTPDRYTRDLICVPPILVAEAQDKITRVVELKTIGENVARKLIDGQPPLAYQVQLQIQMEILGCDVGDLACLIGNRDFQIFEFQRHEKLIQGVIAKCSEFYQHIVSDTPPPLDGSESTLQTIKALHPDDNGETVELPEDAVVAAQILERIKADKKRLEAEENAARVIILNAIGDNTYANGFGVSVSYKTIEGKPYQVQGKKYRRLSITTSKETEEND